MKKGFMILLLVFLISVSMLVSVNAIEKHVFPGTPGMLQITTTTLPNAPNEVTSTSFTNVFVKNTQGNFTGKGNVQFGQIWAAAVGDTDATSDKGEIWFVSDRIYFPGTLPGKTGKIQIVMKLNFPVARSFMRTKAVSGMAKSFVRLYKDTGLPKGWSTNDTKVHLRSGNQGVWVVQKELPADKTISVSSYQNGEVGSYYYAVGGVKLNAPKGEGVMLGRGKSGYGKDGAHVEYIKLRQAMLVN